MSKLPRHHARGLLALVALCAATAMPVGAIAGEAPEAFALDLRASETLVRHPVNDFASQSDVGTQSDPLLGLDFDPNASVLYGINDLTHELGTVALDSGAFVAIGASPPRAKHTWTGLSFDPIHGLLYGSSSDGINESTLYRIDPTTGAVSEIGTQTTASAIVEIAMGCDRVLYGHDVTDNALYRVSTADGSVSFKGFLGLDTHGAQGMDFDHETGLLYAWLYFGPEPGDLTPRYGTIDTETGNFTTLTIDEAAERREFEGATRTVCPTLFTDGFETGGLERWGDVVAP